ncbi:MAG: hypothetical protein AAGB51_14510 [Planctomycetota bacterium]
MNHDTAAHPQTQHPRVAEAQRMFRAVAQRWAHDALRLRASGLQNPSFRGWDGYRPDQTGRAA